MKRLTFALLALGLAALLPATSARADDGSAAISAKAELAVESLRAGLKKRGGVIAVAPVVSMGDAKPFDLGASFGAALVDALRKADFEVRDESTIKDLLGEAAMSETLGGDSDKLEKIQQSLGAKTILVTQLGALGETLVLDVKALDPSTAQVVGATDQKLPLSLFASKKQPSTKAYTGGASDERVEVALRRLTDGLVIQLRKALPDVDLRYLRAGVIPFEEKGKSTKSKELGAVVASEISTILRRDHGVLLVERQQIGKVVDEQARGQSGLIDENTAAEMGKILGVDYLVLGTVGEVGDHFRVDAKVVSAENGKVVASDNRSLPSASLIALSADAVVLRSRSGAAFRSILIPGWGQFYNREPVKGSVFLGAELALFGVATTFHLLGMQDESDYHLPRDQFETKFANDSSGLTLSEIAENLRTSAAQNYRTRNTFLIIAGGLWAYNLLDAYLNGVPANAEGAFVLGAVPTEKGLALSLGARW
ncbi:MAG: FlgO family outer membrane protein [Deltaproteobacteria bacterium]|nr:FlgO family outer membrane protein [Deltaproteobacteria bacterium]